MSGQVIAVSGHRPDKLGGYRVPNPTYTKVIIALRKELEELKPSCMLIGMAQGVDQWTASLCATLKIPFVAALPMDQEAFCGKWPDSGKAALNLLLSKAHQIIVVNKGGYEHFKMQARNQWMVDNSELLLAAFNGTEGGTANCVAYAVSIGRPIKYVDMPSTPELEASSQFRRSAKSGIVTQIMERNRPTTVDPTKPAVAKPKYGRVFAGDDE